VNRPDFTISTGPTDWPLELFGVAGAGIVAAIPGGLFELTFGIWLIARGFASTATVRSRAST
jgi:hypothetical protein